MAREQYQRDLIKINNEVLELAEAVEKNLQNAVQALIDQNKIKAEEIISSDDIIDEQVRKIDRLCYDVLLRQQPVAFDLRIVSVTMKILTDLERVGDHAVDISELTLLISHEKYPSIIDSIKRMSAEMISMLFQAINAFATLEVEDAKKVIEHDDIVDDLFMEIKKQIAVSVGESDVEGELELDLLMVAKYFERVGDHATNIAEWVIFAKTGEFPNN